MWGQKRSPAQAKRKWDLKTRNIMSIEITLIENNVNSFQKPMESEMAKAIKHLEGELVKIRSGRAHTSMIENIPVSLYGQTPSSLKNFATLAAVDARLLTVQPWDASTINEIERAIANSDLGVTPAHNDGTTIQIQLPVMSTDRRNELIKILGKKIEDCKVAIRNVRKDFNNLLRDEKKKKTISEDFFNRLNDVLETVTTKFTSNADQLGKKKETEITSI